MSTDNYFKQLLALPALKNWNTDAIPLLGYEIGLWGKIEGSTDDYKIIAASKSFNLDNIDFINKFYFGDGEHLKKSSVFLWKPIGDTITVASISMSARKDSSNRPSLQILILTSKISTKVIPAPIQALVLLPLLRKKQRLLNSTRGLINLAPDDEEQTSRIRSISGSNHQDISIKPKKLLSSFAVGINYFHSQIKETQLTDLYGALLEGVTAHLSEAEKYPEEVVGTLLSFLTPVMANSFSIIERLPSINYDTKKIEKNWAIILDKTDLETSDIQISRNIKQEVNKISTSLMSFKLAVSSPDKPNNQIENDPKQSLKENTIKLSLWGPPSAGKTVFVSQLYWQGVDSHSDWDIRLLTSDSKQYMSMMYQNIQNNNKFPLGTNVGHDNKIEFLIINEAEDIQATLFIEDRAGAHYSGEAESTEGNLKLEDNIVEILKQSNGLIFLFDPSRKKSVLYNEVWNTMQTLQLELSGGRKKIQIPVAVCLTKADNEIDSLEKLNFALSDPDTFVREYAETSLIELLDKYCENYSLFPVSSVGIKVTDYQVEPIVFYDDGLESRVVPNEETKTINLISPFIWLIDNLRQ